MRITLNLASRPYVDLRPLYSRLRLWMMLMAILAVPFWLLLRVEQRRAAVAQAEQTILTRDMQKLKQEQQNNQVQMRQPQNAAVLAQSEFLNQLFKRKTFSWTAVMMDLETVLPSGVQVMNLEPVIAPDGQVTIRMRINGQRDKAVDLVRNLDRTGRSRSWCCSTAAAFSTWDLPSSLAPCWTCIFRAVGNRSTRRRCRRCGSRLPRCPRPRRRPERFRRRRIRLAPKASRRTSSRPRTAPRRPNRQPTR